LQKRILYLIITFMAELRRDPVSGNWVVSGYTTVKGDSVGECPFCPGNEHLTPKAIREVRGPDGAWLVRCFSAANPVFVVEVGENKRAEGLYDKMGNVGAHEIIVESASHTRSLSDFTEDEFLILLDVYAERILDLKKDKRFKYIQTFKNHGELVGSYILHPHSHVLATPIVPQRIELELENSRMHYMKKERCLFCDIVAQETRQNKRVISMNQNFIAICPFASRFPYEIWILPRFHKESFEGLHEEGPKRDLAALMLDTMKRLSKVANAYSFVIHTSPNYSKLPARDDDLLVSNYFHWHIEVLPRDFRSSRYKREDQFYVVSLTPEEAADSLKAQRV
jgi:UDPglucose--hexose-1-phosphate uridylyltransferase